MLHGRGIVRAFTGCAAVAALLGLAALPGSKPAPGPRGAHRTATISIVPLVHVVASGLAAPSLDGGYTPAQIRTAYELNPLRKAGIDGKGQSIVIVDSFGSPTIAHDLGVFDRQFHLAAPPSLKIIHPAGPIPKFTPTATREDWADETSLDVEWAHAMAPGASIVLVETPVSENEGTSGFPQIEKAEKYVIAHHLGGVISQSFGATEETFPKGTLRPLRGAYIEAAQRAHDITVVSASGDEGATDMQTNENLSYTYPVTSWPASDPLVTSVGGLQLTLKANGQRSAPDRVWNDGGSPPEAGGGGKSVIFGRPSFQNGVESVVGNHRGVPDISMSAACSAPVDVYESFDGGGWQTICGTSEATPLFAGVIALTDQVAGHPIGMINGYLYKMAADKDPGIVDITRGNNTVSFFQQGKTYTVKGWNAVPGYDLASGLGTVDGQYFVRELAALATKK